MWYISLHGDSHKDVNNNILVYHDSGEPHSDPYLLPVGKPNPKLRELRGFAVVGKRLYVVNANKDHSKILQYDEEDGKPGRAGR